MFTDVEECETMVERVLSDEQADGVRWLRLKIAVVDVKNLVEEAADVESETIFLLLRKDIGVLVVEDPAALRECELELVAVVCCLFLTENGCNLRHVEVTDTY